MTRTVRFHRLGGPDVLSIDDIELRKPRAGEVRMRVTHLGLNRAEATFRTGKFGTPVLPSLLGFEASGIVEELGPDVTGLKVGDKVAAMPGMSMSEYGTYGEAILYPAELLVKHPDSITLEQAAAIWMQYVTAYGAIVDIGKLKAGQAVVIPAASSSVGLAAVEIVNVLGGISIAVTRGRSKVDAIKKNGAHHVIVSDEENYVERVMAITKGAGADMFFDPVVGDTLAKHVQAAKPGAIVFIYGLLSPEASEVPVVLSMVKAITIRGYSMGELVHDKTRLETAKSFILKHLASGDFKPVIDRRFAFDDIVEAHRYLEGNTQIGKIIVTVNGGK